MHIGYKKARAFRSLLAAEKLHILVPLLEPSVVEVPRAGEEGEIPVLVVEVADERGGSVGDVDLLFAGGAGVSDLAGDPPGEELDGQVPRARDRAPRIPRPPREGRTTHPLAPTRAQLLEVRREAVIHFHFALEFVLPEKFLLAVHSRVVL